MGERVALVTGAGKGIGRAISLQLAQRGIQDIILLSRTANDLEAVRDEIERRTDSRAAVFAADLRDPATYDRLFSFIEHKFGKLDYHVNNAASEFSLHEADTMAGVYAQLDRYVGTMLTPVMAFGSARFRGLLERSEEPKVLDVLSSAAIRMYPGNNGYHQVKVAHMETSLRLLAETNGRIRTYRLYPSNTDTQMAKEIKAEFNPPLLSAAQVAEHGVAMLLDDIATDLCLMATPQGIAVRKFSHDYAAMAAQGFDHDELRSTHYRRLHDELLPLLKE